MKIEDRQFQLGKLQNHLREFAKDREWDQFHTPKNLSMALAVEASELMELFQWLKPEESISIMNDNETAQKVRDEIADIVVYTSRIADILEIDLEEAVWTKMEANAAKYPVDKSKGRSTKYTDL
jgi:NTP pyrophosphatase (non-canonical NTP hydrolase)